ncbi:hypothetical protein J2785_002172, partial [Burkholderia ambifaria]
MNKSYRNVWNASTGTWTAVAETAKGRTKGASRVRAVAAAVALMGVMAGANASEACKTEDGQKGSLNASGLCTVASIGSVSTMGVSSIGTMATMLDDTYIKVLSNNGAVASSAAGTGSIAIGDGALSSGTSGSPAIAIGTKASASGTNTLALGGNAKATNTSGAYSATAIGVNAAATGASALVVGESAQAVADGASVFGHHAGANGNQAVAIGGYASATAANAVALGSGSVANTANTVSVGNATTQRKIVNMAAGTANTDAVNVSQLSPVVSALGGGASINSATGAVTGPTYSLANGGTQSTVGGALTALDGALTHIANGTAGLVRQTGAGANLTVGANTDGAAVDFTGKAGTRTLTGVADGALSATSADAVNGSQLYATNQNVSQNAT